MNVDKIIGNNIRKYRIAYGMTLKTLAERIHKSISTVSKYEKGDISLDMPTFMEIAKLFDASPSMLLTDTEALPSPEVKETASPDILYMYTYSTPDKAIVLSIIERYPYIDQPNAGKVQLFNEVKDARNPGDCGGLYSGTYVKNGFLETYNLHNQMNLSEYVMISCVANLANATQRTGLVSGLSNYTMFPVSFKTIISDYEINDTDFLKDILLLSKENFKTMKKTNTLTILNS